MRLFLFFGVILAFGHLHAQPKLDFELKKPKEFQERKLGSEKSEDKKFTVVRRFFQNTYTHFNYYFNANNMVNEIIATAAMSHVDDYTELLSYYPWQLEKTAASQLIDSILKTATAGILLHDLRNSWIDDMYLLIGKAYFLRNDFDSASMTFQHLNYSFANKDKDGYHMPIGSNSEEGSNSFAILSKERDKYLLKKPPSRNDAFVWKIRNDIERKNFIDASSLIAIVRNDPNFPERLEPALNEVIGYLFYKIETWDSAAHYLEKAMPLASGPSDRARRWFLTGQLYQLGNNPQKASEAYSKCLGLATDIVMDVYARLNSIRLRKGEDPNVVEQNVKELIAMARRDKYTDYRDIIYYAAAMVEIERNGYEAADQYLQKSLENSTNNPKQKNISRLALADLRFDQKKYGLSGLPYDSVEVSLLKPNDAVRTQGRKPPTLAIYKAETKIFLQDSLLALANLPDEDRNRVVRKLSNQLRKSKGLEEEEVLDLGSEVVSGQESEDEAVNLFSPTTGNWYFYDPSIRARGFNSFKQRWGARPNDDNWRRSSALSKINPAITREVEESGGDPDGFIGGNIEKSEEELFDSTDVSFDNLYSRIPITPERRAKAEWAIIEALYSKAKALHEQIEDYPEAIKVYEEILRRRDTGKLVESTLFGLIHCYSKTGDMAKANAAKSRLEKMNPDMLAKKENTQSRKVLDETYERIYGLFLEGQFSRALEEKRKADSLLGNSYWKPQLLYIQSVYHIRQREDSLAIVELNNIVSTFPDHKLTPKSKRVIDVLKRRSEIEDYLTNLKVTRVEEDEVINVAPPPTARELPKVQVWSSEDSARITEATLLVQKQAEEAAKAEEERKAREKVEADRLAKEEADRAAKAEIERNEREDAEKAAKAEADRLAKEEADRAAKTEKERMERVEAEKAAKAEADRLAKEEADRAAKAEKERMEREEAEKAAKAEADRLAKAEADRAAKAEKDRIEREEAEKAAKALADRMEKEEADRAAKEKADRLAEEKALAKKQAEEKRKADEELAIKMAAEKEKAERELAQKQALERERAEKELAEKQAKEKEALDKEAANRVEAEKRLAEKQAAEKAALEKELAEKLAADKEKAEKEAAEKAAAEKAAAEKALAEKQAAEKAASENLAKEKAEKERLEREQREAALKAETERLAKEREIKEAAEKAEAETLAKQKKEAEEKAERLAKEKAEKEAAEKAEAETLAKQKKEAEEKADRLAKEKAEKEAAEKAALLKTQMVDNVVVGIPTTPSPFKINANEKQVVIIVLERIDPAYVNEVSYTLTHSSMRKIDSSEVNVVKKKIRENLWLVELRSEGFKNMQAAYQYINYIKPIIRNELVTWLEDSKYYVITLSETSLKEIEKSGDVKLYYQVLKEAVPGKF